MNVVKCDGCGIELDKNYYEINIIKVLCGKRLLPTEKRGHLCEKCYGEAIFDGGVFGDTK